ncbi:MAG: lipase family protein, partial [bacterium]|nr:lipase family protein [bacterium]
MRLKPLFIFCITFLFIGYVTYASSPDHLGLRHDINSADSAEDGVDPISDKDTLVRLVKYAKYCDLVGENDQKILEKFPKASIYVTEKTKVKFFVVRDDANETQTIVIRGSANLTNWIVDFKFWKIKDAWIDIRVHKGFYEATREVFWDSVFDLNPTYKTTITGHSLGGAIAIMLGMYLDSFGHPDTDVITFGQPRITNKSGATKYKEFPFQRVVIAMDLIPHLPPGFLGYRHFGNKWHLKHKNSTTDQPVIVSEDDAHEEDPQEALDLWDKWVEGVDQSNTPVMRPPIIARMWMSLRSDDQPASMAELFESDEWKRLKAINSTGNSASSKDRLFDLNGEI